MNGLVRAGTYYLDLRMYKTNYYTSLCGPIIARVIAHHTNQRTDRVSVCTPQIYWAQPVAGTHTYTAVENSGIAISIHREEEAVVFTPDLRHGLGVITSRCGTGIGDYSIRSRVGLPDVDPMGFTGPV